MDAQCPMEEAKLLFHHRVFSSTVMWSQTASRSRLCRIILKDRLEELQFFISLCGYLRFLCYFYSMMDGGKCLFLCIAYIWIWHFVQLKDNCWSVRWCMGFAVSKDQSYQGQEMQRTLYWPCITLPPCSSSCHLLELLFHELRNGSFLGLFPCQQV